MSDPASDLREAAALMRERALAATQGRWHHLCMGSEGCSVINDGHLRDRKHVAFFGRKEWKADHADACYVAGMPPAVALAVADWLDFVADADSMHSHAAACNCRDRALIGRALTVARSYLGREDAK